MTRDQALKKAIKLFGKNAVIIDYAKDYRKNRGGSSPEKRAEARAARETLKAKCQTAEQKKEHRKELDELLFCSLHYRYSIGVIVMGMFNSIKACGDSWEGCFRALEKDHTGTAHE